MSIYPTRLPYRNVFVAAFSQQEIDTVSDTFIESSLVFGDEAACLAAAGTPGRGDSYWLPNREGLGNQWRQGSANPSFLL